MPAAIHEDIDPDWPVSDDDLARREIATHLQNLGDQGYFMDILIFTHGGYNGGEGSIGVVGRNIGPSNLLDFVGTRDKLPIRMVYQMNCFSSLLNDEWIELGAQTVSGSRYVNFLPTIYTYVFGHGQEGWFEGDSYYYSVYDNMYQQEGPLTANVVALVYTVTGIKDMMEEDPFNEWISHYGNQMNSPCVSYDACPELSQQEEVDVIYWSSKPLFEGDSSITINSPFEGSKNVCGGCPEIYHKHSLRSDNDSCPDVCDNCPNDDNDDQMDSDSDNIGDECDNCPDVNNPKQVDKDQDGVGDVCEKPDLSLIVEYDSYTEDTLNDGDKKLSWVMTTKVRNTGSKEVEEGVDLKVTWTQGVVTESSEDPSNVKSLLNVKKIGSGNKVKVILNPDLSSDEDDEGLVMSAVILKPIERTETITLKNGLPEGSEVEFSQQSFTVTLDEGVECAEVIHNIVLEETPEVDETDESNNKYIEAYNTMKNCVEVLEISPEQITEGIIGPTLANDPGKYKEWEKDVVEAGMDQVYEHLDKIGPDGGLIDMGTLVLNIPQGSLDRVIPFNVKQVQAKNFKGITSVGDTFQIQSSKNTRFNTPVTLTLGYDEGKIPEGVSETDLSLLHHNKGIWNALPSQVNQELNTVSASVNSFSLFTVGILGKPMTRREIQRIIKTSEKDTGKKKRPMINKSMRDKIRPKDWEGQKRLANKTLPKRTGPRSVIGADHSFIKPHIKKGDKFIGIREIKFQGKSSYNLRKTRRGRFLGLIPVDVNVNTIIDNQTGQILHEKKPWWSIFLSGL